MKQSIADLSKIICVINFIYICSNHCNAITKKHRPLSVDRNYLQNHAHIALRKKPYPPTLVSFEMQCDLFNLSIVPPKMIGKQLKSRCQTLQTLHQPYLFRDALELSQVNHEYKTCVTPAFEACASGSRNPTTFLEVCAPASLSPA